MSIQVIFYANDNLFELLGLKNAETGAFINTATVTLNLHKKSDDSLVAGAGPLNMTYRTASNGEYVATIPDTANVDRNERYIAKITADGGAGLQGYWEIQVQSQVRYE